MGTKWWSAGGLALFAAVAIAACGGSGGTTPTPTTNAPPVIQSILVAASQVEADQEVQLTATVTDAETPPAQLTYTWSASPVNGTFAGTGSQVKWRAPNGAPTPGTATITLVVTETYNSQGAQTTNRVSTSVQIRYNDSPDEISGLVGTFLTDFGTYTISATQCVRNFSEVTHGPGAFDCRAGKASEFTDIQHNRERTDFRVESAAYTPPAVAFVDSQKTLATASTTCTFMDRNVTTGVLSGTRGTCDLTAVYENFRWYLCNSEFNGPFTPVGASRFAPTMLRSALPRFSYP